MHILFYVHQTCFVTIFFGHFSAGIGRTGTYIALDSLYHAGKRSGRVNVAEYVKTMRANRMNMIQTYVSIVMLDVFKNDLLVNK